MKTWRSWTTKELAALADMRRDGLTTAEIAVELQRSVWSVKCRLSAEHVRRYRSLLLHRWLPSFRQPHTIQGLAAEFGVSLNAVKQAKRRLRHAGYDVLPACKGRKVKA